MRQQATPGRRTRAPVTRHETTGASERITRDACCPYGVRPHASGRRAGGAALRARGVGERVSVGISLPVRGAAAAAGEVGSVAR